ncbi:uncharacterized protein Z518_05251 [Rhinocladiella mackenziei CBS 650.93]|uniref:Rhinocladiella mackenziei CBS 650.93 unplaced genomic scaffold supercont1.4, whole genome shotgun sequence n=1 Tax=Rhinocladiella mackenziei CBS 650.93 TaxID=1442369 RepID=A0A0D2H1R1_9EURO|nr:uncharacterized protein Z518_05251 [Rhinocladiella mackenziei CBS 650.93]KIX04383.1 hypothetical protein Z518_05251 [Rhinocladiella mackenziei CBS 650.93]
MLQSLKLRFNDLPKTIPKEVLTGRRPVNLLGAEACAYDVAEALVSGGVLPEAIYNHAVKLFGREGAAELIYLTGVYCLVAVTLNGYDVKAPTAHSVTPAETTRPSEYQTLNPVTEKVEKVFPETTDAEVQAALDTAQKVHQNDWRLRPVTERAGLVAQAAFILRQQSEKFAQLMTREMGKLIDQSRYEVVLTADILEYYASHGEKFLEPKLEPEAPGVVLATEPIGVILAIEPWNFPLYQLVRVAAPQVVAGNVVIFKHAPSVPQCALAFAHLFEEVGFPTGVYTNLLCTVDQVHMLIDDFRVRAVTLTGSERAGASVAERAGRNLKKVVLELGGSDPLVVLPDADLEDALNQGVMGRMICMGQACVASKRFIVIGQERGKLFLDGMTRRMGALQAGDPADSKTSLGPLVSERALNDLLDQIEMAKANGDHVVLGGKRMNRPGWYLEPTITTDISPENPFFQQEASGPVASFYVVDTEEEAIQLANATKFGLGGAVFGADVIHA